MLIEPLLGAIAGRARPLLAVGVFLGILLPPLAALCRPLLTPAVVGTLTFALLRLDWQRLHAGLDRPALPGAITLWLLVVSPLLSWLIATGLGLTPALGLALVLQSAAPPIGAAAVFALMLGADAVLALLVTVASVALLPVTLTVLAAALSDQGLTVDLWAFFGRVSLLVTLPFMLAGVLRRWLGPVRLARNQVRLEGLNVLLLLIFAFAVMDGIGPRLLNEPGYIGGLLMIACLVTAVLHLLGWLAFRRASPPVALSAAVCSGNRNMGLILAVTAGSAGPLFSHYVAVAQIPMYFAPLIIGLLARRLQPD